MKSSHLPLYFVSVFGSGMRQYAEVRSWCKHVCIVVVGSDEQQQGPPEQRKPAGIYWWLVQHWCVCATTTAARACSKCQPVSTHGIFTTSLCTAGLRSPPPPPQQQQQQQQVVVVDKSSQVIPRLTDRSYSPSSWWPAATFHSVSSQRFLLVSRPNAVALSAVYCTSNFCGWWKFS